MRAVLFLFSFLFCQELLSNTGRNTTDPQQIWECGLPYVTQYTPDHYKAAAQNWCFAQDNNGIMYVGNSAGILEFDGIFWHLIRLANESRISSLCKGNDGTIFVGGSGDLGYLAKDSLGEMQFYSLLTKLDPPFRDFSDVWHIYAVKDTIYFITAKYIFRWVNDTFNVLSPKSMFGFAFLVRDELYIDDRGTGIMQLINDSLRLIPNGSVFRPGGVTVMNAYGQNDILVISALDGPFLYDHHKITPVKNKFIKSIKTYGSVILPNNDILVYTIGDGAFLFDAEGHFRQRLDRSRGLTSDVIYGAFVDKDGGLWLACDNGINRVEISSPIRLFNEMNGLAKGAGNILSTSSGFFVSTNDGLFRFTKDEPGFQQVEGINNMTRDLVAVHNGVLVGNLDALYLVDDRIRAHRIRFGGDSYTILLKSAIDTTKVYVAGNSGNIYELTASGREWKLGKTIFNINGKITQMIEDRDALWINTRFDGIYKVLLKKNKNSQSPSYRITHLDIEDGLPSLNNNYLCRSGDQLYLSSKAGLYLFNSLIQKFGTDTMLMGQIGQENIVTGTLAASEDGLWIAIKSDFQNRVYRSSNGLVKEIVPLRSASDFEVSNIYDSSKDIVFFSGPKGIIAFHTGINQEKDISFPLQIRKVLLNNDSLLLAGLSPEQSGEHPVSLPFPDNSVRFVYALPNYDKPGFNQYQYYLEGYDKNWSGWSAETQRDFTNLPEGKYRFRVRAKNMYSTLSDEARFAFTILPPWYRTWWAYLFYSLTLLGITGLIVQWRSRHLRHEKELLENIVRERTRQLEEQAEKLKEMDQQKSRFFANISHEFRTPLTLIKGPIEQMLQSQEGSLTTEDKLMIRNNADRLHRLVNQLLDLSRLDANTLQLNPAVEDIFSFLRVVGSAFSSYAEQRNMTYHILVPDHELYVRFDHDKMEKIIYNLLSNAFKFTPDQGMITLDASFTDGLLTIGITDTGIGIPTRQLPYIFDRFYQVDSSHAREHEGAGIGLALTKELIVLMKGDIQVESQPGKGSRFMVMIPVKEIPAPTTAPLSSWSKTFSRPGATEAIDPVHSTKRAVLKKDHSGEESPIVLIIEDNRDMRAFIRKQLEESYLILEASDGKNGLKTAKKEVPDLIITDLMMPQMDGVTLCKRLKANEYTSHIPVIMLTAKAGQEYKIEGLETGADSYLTKPFDTKELQIRVNNLISQRQQLREKFSREIILQPRNISITGMDEQFLGKVEHVIEQNLSDEHFGVPQMQNALAMSKVQLHRKMKALTGQAPGEFLRHYRLRRAAQLLLQQGGNVTEIAYSVGFNNLSYFAKCFKELHGVAPSAYSKQA